MKLWCWQIGRQRLTEYYKFPLWFFRIGNYGFDAYILKYEKGTLLEYHTDKIHNANHWRLNIHILGDASFFISKPSGVDLYNNCLCLFRPDIYAHSLKVRKKTIKLSFGFVKFK